MFLIANEKWDYNSNEEAELKINKGSNSSIIQKIKKSFISTKENKEVGYLSSSDISSDTDSEEEYEAHS